LIKGESVKGKELIAKAIHFKDIRKKRTFASINCGEMPENLLESEIFAYKIGNVILDTEQKVSKTSLLDELLGEFYSDKVQVPELEQSNVNLENPLDEI
jgi:transcriptional regulator with GAF, ATPase, and Fis domain